MVNANYSTSLLAGTFERYMRNKPTDVIFGDVRLFPWLNKKTKMRLDGGERILEPLLYRESTAVGSYRGAETLDLTVQETNTNAEFEYQQYYMTVVIDGRTKLLNSGKARQVNILATKIRQAKTSLANLMNSHCFLDGTGNSNKNLTGLAAMVLNSGTYAGINRTNDTWWKANSVATSGSLSITGAGGWRRMYNDCSLGMGNLVPDAIITTQILYEAYEATMDTNMRFTRNDDGPNHKGYSLRYKDAEVWWDDACQSQTTYFLNSEVMNLVVHEARAEGDMGKEEGYAEGHFRLGEFESPPNQDVESAKAFWMGNLTANNCRLLGKLTAQTNS